MRRRFCLALVQALCVLTLTGCGRFVAHRMVQSPNTYPSWLRPSARVTLALDDYFSTNVPPREVRVGPPGATLNYRVVEPRDYKYKTSFTNWMQNGRPHYSISCHVRMPGETNIWSTAPFTPSGVSDARPRIT